MKLLISPLLAALLLLACGESNNSKQNILSTPEYSSTPDTVLTVYLHSIAGDKPSWLLFDRVRYIAGKELKRMGRTRIKGLAESGFIIENDRKEFERAVLNPDARITFRGTARGEGGALPPEKMSPEKFREAIARQDDKRFRRTPFRITLHNGQIKIIEELYIR